MNKAWLLLGFMLPFSACSSDEAETPSVTGAGGGSGGSPAAGTLAVAGGGGATLPAGGRGMTQAGAGAIGAPAAGSGGARPPAAGGGAAQAGTGGVPPAGGRSGAGAAAAGAAAGAGAGGPGAAGAPAAGSGGAGPGGQLERFSFFVTSLAGLQRLSKSEKGFGGDLRYGEANGLAGADKICRELAESSMPGAAAKEWRAFLSVAQGPEGGPVHAIDRVGEGPWYDRLGRIVAMNKAALLATRPMGADPAIINDLPNEDGIPNQRPNPGQPAVNNHHFLTGSDTMGKLYRNAVTSTCNNWTSTEPSAGRPRIGFSYPAGNRQHWISGQDEGGCGAGTVLVDMGGSDPSNPIVGSGGGYGGFYCFALQP